MIHLFLLGLQVAGLFASAEAQTSPASALGLPNCAVRMRCTHAFRLQDAVWTLLTPALLTSYGAS